MANLNRSLEKRNAYSPIASIASNAYLVIFISVMFLFLWKNYYLIIANACFKLSVVTSKFSIVFVIATCCKTVFHLVYHVLLC